VIHETHINDFVADVLVRYFRAAVAQGFLAPQVLQRSTTELLTQYWALSKEVRELVTYLQNSTHELQAVLATERQIHRDTVRGRLAARETQILRLSSGQPTWTVCITPLRTFDSGANKVLSWVLSQVSASFRNADKHWGGTHYQLLANELQLGLEAIRRFEPVRDLLESASSTEPSKQGLNECFRSRRRIYRYAGSAFALWQNMRAGHPSALRSVFNDVILGPAPIWQRFEIAVGLAAARALSEALGGQLLLGSVLASSQEPFAQVGKLLIYWQNRTSWFSSPRPEASESIASEIYAELRLWAGGDRPDFVVVDTQEGRVLSVLEAKYFEDSDDDGAGAIRLAVEQLVRYARGYRPMSEVRSLLRKSVVALSQSPRFVTVGMNSRDAPWIADFNSLSRGDLLLWAREVLAGRRPLASAA
jgi:hypothetical protein